jgi:hypothetical protein
MVSLQADHEHQPSDEGGNLPRALEISTRPAEGHGIAEGNPSRSPIVRHPVRPNGPAEATSLAVPWHLVRWDEHRQPCPLSPVAGDRGSSANSRTIPRLCPQACSARSSSV